jgi:hypothetical protein
LIVDGGQYNTIKGNTFTGHIYVVFWVHTANNTFENNVIYNIEDCERVWDAGPTTASNSNGTIIRGNEVYNLTKPGGLVHIDIFQVVDQGANVANSWLIENNYFHDIDGQIGINEMAARSTGWIFRNNVFANINESMMLMSPDTVIYNNTFFQTTANTADTWDFGESGLIIKNNIMIGQQSATNTGLCYVHDDGTSAVIQNNFFALPKDSSYGARDSTRFTNDCGGTAEGNINGGDPKFIAAYNNCVTSTCNFNLQASSPLIGMGATLAGFTTDKSGATRSVPWDIGAYEYQSETDTTAPVRSALAPSGSQACSSDPRDVVLSLTTNEAATCKGSPTDEAYASMDWTFDGTGTTSHTKTLSQACDATYQFFVRCQDAIPNINLSSVEINYTIAPYAADTTKPTWTSSTLGTNGRTLTLVFNEAVKRGASYADTQVTITPTGGAATLSYVSGDSSTTLVYYSSRDILSTETLTTSIAQPGNGIEDLAGNDLDAVATKATTNSSTLGTPTAEINRTIWSTDVPTGDNSGDGTAINIGTRFTSSVAGSITGGRFYKQASDTGTHILSLYDATGTVLATKTVSGETASGWQSQSFDSAVSIAANTVYTIAYFCPTGYYFSTASYFGSAPTINSPLTALQSAVETGYNGAYLLNATAAFPSSGSPTGRNYWVDVNFNFVGSVRGLRIVNGMTFR